jgi:hypothetical protein
MDIAAFEEKAKVRQSLLIYLKGETNLKGKVRLSIFDSHFQYGVIKVHLQADIMENPDKGQPILDDETQIPLMDESNQPLIGPDFLPANQAYCITRVHPDDFLVDEDAGPLDDDVSWKAQRIKRPLEDVKADKKYRKAARDLVKATEINDESERLREQRKKGGVYAKENEASPDTVVLWEVYDRKNKNWLVLAEGCNEFLIEPEEIPPGIDGDPFIDIRFTLRDDSWYPLPPISQQLDAQKEYCELRSKIMVHRKRFNRKYTAYTAAFDDSQQAMSQLENGEDGTVIPCNQPTQVIWPIADAPLDQQIHLENGYIRQDFMDLAIGANQRGATAGVDSATEAGILEKRTQIREGDKLSTVMDFMQNVARKLDQLVQAHITQDQAVKVTGPQGEEVWELIRTTDYDSIDGEYEYSIDVGTVTPQLPEIERAQWVGFMGMVAQAPWLATNKRLMAKTAELFHIHDQAMLDELAAMAQQMMQQMGGGSAGAAGGQANLTAANPMSLMGGMAAGVNNVRGGQQ